MQRVLSTQVLRVLPCLLTHSVLLAAVEENSAHGKIRLTCSRGDLVVFLYARIPERVDARFPPSVDAWMSVCDLVISCCYV
jgi:hypothetical protein